MTGSKTKGSLKALRTRLAAAAAASALLTAGCATTQNPTSGQALSLGQNAAGDPCEATVNWTDPSFKEEEFSKQSRSYSVGCRGRLTTGTQARVRIFDTKDELNTFTGSLSCGSSTSIALPGFSDASARRCVDPALGLQTIVMNTAADGKFYQLSTAANAVGPGVQALRTLAGFDADGAVTSDRQIAGLGQIPAGPSGAGTGATTANLDLEETLGIATRQIFLGNYANASSLLKSALVLVDDDTQPSIEAELLLEAGLADSNIRFFGSAKERFSEAEELLRSPNIDRARILGRKLAIYRGLDALNQREFAQAKAILTSLTQGQVSGDQPLLDPVGLSRLNSGGGDSDVRNSLNLPDEEQSRELVLEAQANWALSVASISENDLTEARQSLMRARTNIASLQGVERAGVLWLEARLDRQLGRILATQGNYTEALEAFGNADTKMRQSALAGVGTGTEPAIAELSLQEASVIERSGASQSAIDAAYAKAVTALVNARGQQTTFATAPLSPYLDRLLEKSKAGDQSVLPAYFQALQVSGESGAAQQISQLQAQAESSPEIGALIRAHGDAKRKLNQVEFDIRSGGSADDDLNNTLTQLQQEFTELDAKLQNEGKINRLSDRPATLKELQDSLAPGEVYIKLTIIGDAIYGLLIEEDAATPYKAAGTASYTQSLVGDIRSSIDGSFEISARRENFNVFFASIVYDALFKEIDAQLDGRSSMVIDSGPILKAITPAVLVTDPNAQVLRSADGQSEDYSQVPFMIQKAPISIASSPSSFIASRKLGASNAAKPLIGFADPRPLADAASASSKTAIGPCDLTPVDLVNLSARYGPIPRREVDLAARALGLNNFEVISGDEFTDQKLLELGQPDGSLGDYKILHFATHGASEGQFGCEDSPSALLTSFGDGASDMLLSFKEIPNLNLDANLVVLSACETETVLGEESLQLAGGIQPGETLAGLVKAFFSANAKAVMATYWKASAEADSEIFFETFYSSGRTKSIASSLQDAQTELIQTGEYSHPYFWGPFFVVGNTANGMLAEGSVARASDKTQEPDRIAALSQ